MNCPVCNTELPEGLAYCTNCGSKIVMPANEEPAVNPDVTSAVEEAQAAVRAVSEPAADAADAAAEVADAPAVAEATEAAEAAEAAAEEGGSGVAASIGAAAAAVAASGAAYDRYEQRSSSGAGMPAADAEVPSYQQQFYEQRAQAQAESGYQTPYEQQRQEFQQQQQQAAAKRDYARVSGTQRALAMSAYWGFLPLLFAIIVGDKSTDAFLRQHLNQALTLFIAGFISAMLTALLIGFILMILVLIFTIMGTVNAYNSEMTPLPLIGNIKFFK